MERSGYTNPYRTGFPGRGRGGSGSGSRFTSQDARSTPNNPNALAIHPRSRFGKLNIKPRDLVVQEVGYYSLMCTGDRQGDISIFPDRRCLRVMQIECKPGEEKTIKYDLDEGFDEGQGAFWMKFIHFRREIPTLWSWLQTPSGNSRVEPIRQDIEFVSSKSVLGDLMKSVYNKDARDAKNWIFGAAKVGSVIVIGHIVRDGVDSVFEVEGPVAHPQDKAAYRGRRFETCVTKSEDNENGYSDDTGYPKFRSVFHVKLKDINILMECGIDAADPFSRQANPKNYVDLTIMPKKYMEANKKKTLYGERLFRWWTNNILPNIEMIYVGLHDDGQVSGIKTYRMGDIPNMIAMEEAALGRAIWSPAVCLGFMHELLLFVKKHVVKPVDEAVYEFRCPASNDTEGYTCQEILAKTAVGHVYIPDLSEGQVF